MPRDWLLYRVGCLPFVLLVMCVAGYWRSLQSEESITERIVSFVLFSVAVVGVLALNEWRNRVRQDRNRTGTEP